MIFHVFFSFSLFSPLEKQREAAISGKANKLIRNSQSCFQWKARRFDEGALWQHSEMFSSDTKDLIKEINRKQTSLEREEFEGRTKTNSFRFRSCFSLWNDWKGKLWGIHRYCCKFSSGLVTSFIDHDQDVLTGLSTFVIKYVFRPAFLSASSRFSPNAGSTSNSPCRKLKVFSEIWTRLLESCKD